MTTIDSNQELLLNDNGKSRICCAGTMAEWVRKLNWSSTPLGAISTWPATLLCNVNMVLAAPVPLQLFWGPEFVCIYNDALSPALSNKHPSALGRPAREVWAEAWDVVGPQMEAVRLEKRSFNFEDIPLRLLKDGELEEQYWTYSYSPIFDPDGEVVGVLDIAQNTTEAVRNRDGLKQTVADLRKSEDRFRLLVDRASVGINIGDSLGTLTYINATLLSLLGYTDEEVRDGKIRWNEITPEKYAAADRRALEELQQTGVATPYQKSYRAKDGRLVPMQVGAVLIPAAKPDAAEDDIAVFFTDLTVQKKAEAALLQAEKLGAVGKLASAISHEINNPLEAITNVLFIVRQMAGLPQGAIDYLEVADRELARVSQVAVQTLRFHRQSTAAIDIHPDLLVEEVLQLYASRLQNYRIEVKRQYDAGISFRCFEGDVRQVLNNLIGNATDAMNTGGTLTIRTRESVRPSTGQRGIRITVADSGTGVSTAARERLFDAFYTTKGNNGTGLGLWISCRIVHKHRGYVRSHNALGKSHGAVFQLWLPLELAASAHEPWHVGMEPSLA